MKRLVAVLLVVVLAVSFAGCKKKEQQQLPPGHPGMEGGQMQPQAGGPKVERAVNVPAAVKAKWKAVKLIIEDKSAKSTKEYTVNVGGELAVPNTKMKIKVLAFLPHFMMTDKDITSASDKPNMPAVQISVTEPGKDEWKGWIFSMQPEMHPFMHDKIGIKLAGGVSK